MFISAEDVSPFLITNLISEELDVVDNCAEKSSNNYHAWSHRIWLIKQMKSSSQISFIYSSELFESGKWLSTHISDYSGLHYRQFCLKNLLGIQNYLSQIDPFLNVKYRDTLKQFLLTNLPNLELSLDNKSFTEKKNVNIILGSILDSETDSDKYVKIYDNVCLLVNELMVNEDLCRMYSSHESLWCHRRFILQQLITMIFEYFGETRPKINNSSSELNDRHIKVGINDNIISSFRDTRKNVIVDRENFSKEPKILRCDNHSIYSSMLYKALTSNERKYIDERFKGGDEFSKRYETWLKVILNFSV